MVFDSTHAPGHNPSTGPQLVPEGCTPGDPRQIPSADPVRRQIMIPNDLAEQVRSEVQRLKKVQDEFLQTYKQLCQHYGGEKWPRSKIDIALHRVRAEVIPIMEEAGLDHNAVQALCSWAEKLVLQG
jgi:hypothetical protein